MQLPGPTWGVMPHLGQPGPLVKRDPDPRWGSRAAGEARGRPDPPLWRGCCVKHMMSQGVRAY